MQTSLHWSVKRTSFSLLLIIEFTSCSLEDKMTHNSTQGSTADGDVREADDNGLLNRRKIVAIRAETRLWKWTLELLCGRNQMTNRTTKHSPDDVHVCVSISHVQPQQGRDVIGGRGRTHIPSDDVHSAGTGCYVISLMNNRVLDTWVSQSTHSEWDRRTLALICTNVSFRCHVRVNYTVHNHHNVINTDIFSHMQRTVHNITEEI